MGGLTHGTVVLVLIERIARTTCAIELHARQRLACRLGVNMRLNDKALDRERQCGKDDERPTPGG
jgi:hypothetical protein